MKKKIMYKYLSVTLLVSLSIFFTHCGAKRDAAVRELSNMGDLSYSDSDQPVGNEIINECLQEGSAGCMLMLQTISLDQKTTTRAAAPKVEINTVLDNSASMQLVMDKVINSLTNDNLKDVFKQEGAPEVKFDHFSIYRDYNQAGISSNSSLFPDALQADYSDIYNLVRPLNKKNNGRRDTYGWQNWKSQNDLYISRLPEGSSDSDVDLFFNQLKNEMNQYLAIEDRVAQEDMGCALNLFAASSEEMIHGGDEYIKNLNNNPDNMKITIASQGEINGLNYRGNQCRKARTKNKLISPSVPCDETQPYIAPSGPIYQNNYSRGYHRFRSWRLILRYKTYNQGELTPEQTSYLTFDKSQSSFYSSSTGYDFSQSSMPCTSVGDSLKSHILNNVLNKSSWSEVPSCSLQRNQTAYKTVYEDNANYPELGNSSKCGQQINGKSIHEYAEDKGLFSVYPIDTGYCYFMAGKTTQVRIGWENPGQPRICAPGTNKPAQYSGSQYVYFKDNNGSYSNPATIFFDHQDRVYTDPAKRSNYVLIIAYYNPSNNTCTLEQKANLQDSTQYAQKYKQVGESRGYTVKLFDICQEGDYYSEIIQDSITELVEKTFIKSYFIQKTSNFEVTKVVIINRDPSKNRTLNPSDYTINGNDSIELSQNLTLNEGDIKVQLTYEEIAPVN